MEQTAGWHRAALTSSWPLTCLQPASKPSSLQQTLGLKHWTRSSAPAFTQPLPPCSHRDTSTNVGSITRGPPRPCLCSGSRLLFHPSPCGVSQPGLWFLPRAPAPQCLHPGCDLLLSWQRPARSRSRCTTAWADKTPEVAPTWEVSAWPQAGTSQRAKRENIAETRSAVPCYLSEQHVSCC